LNVNDDVI